jgi:acyl carrier protein
MNDDLERRLHEVAAMVLGVDPDVLSDETSPETLSDWTSVQHLSLIAAVEETFSIHFSVADIYTARSLGALRNLVSEHVNRGPVRG